LFNGHRGQARPALINLVVLVLVVTWRLSTISLVASVYVAATVAATVIEWFCMFIHTLYSSSHPVNSYCLDISIKCKNKFTFYLHTVLNKQVCSVESIIFLFDITVIDNCETVKLQTVLFGHTGSIQVCSFSLIVQFAMVRLVTEHVQQYCSQM